MKEKSLKDRQYSIKTEKAILRLDRILLLCYDMAVLYHDRA